MSQEKNSALVISVGIVIAGIIILSVYFLFSDVSRVNTLESQNKQKQEVIANLNLLIEMQAEEISNLKTRNKILRQDYGMMNAYSDHIYVPSFVLISPTFMNILYVGMPNYLEIAVPGIPSNKIYATITSGSISKKGNNGEFSAFVSKRGRITVTVLVELPDGSKKIAGSREFRARALDDPFAQIDGKSGGSITAARMRIQRGIFAIMYNSPWCTKFTVKSFRLVYRPLGSAETINSKVTSALFVGPMQDCIKSAQIGDLYFFTDIKVKGPDGSNRTIQSIAFEII
ncbi:MAG: hypothetical protein IIA45_03610 [Bacteroidetes bacterium]|nr:hypothetical protein [Bacteroidota bacterium]